MRRTPSSLVATLCAVLALAAPAAFAQAAGSWKWQAALYGYLPDIGGKTTFPDNAGGSGIVVDASTLVDNLKMTFMGSLEGHNGSWGLLTDVIYMDLGNTKSGVRDLTLGGLPLPGSASADLRYGLKGAAWTLAGLWRLSRDPASTMDLVAGARLFDMRQTLGWEFTGNLGPIALPNRVGESQVKLSNWDAIVGLKGRTAFGEGGRWFMPYHVDVGTGESKLTWQAMAGLGYAFKWGDVVVAWRYLDYDFKSGGRIESMDFNGPAIAAVFHW
jgi:hypothetical protein